MVNHFPKSNMHDVPVNLMIYVNFNEEIDPLSINNYSVSLSNGEYEIPGKVSYLSSLKRLTFKPFEPLEKGNTYIFRVFAGLTAINGDLLNKDILFEFDTGQKKDLILPQITSSTPSPGDKDIKPNSIIKITFSKPINPKTIQNSIKFLGGTRTVKFKVDYFPKNCLLKITPLNNFEYSKKYKILLSNKLMDLSGNHLAKDYSLEFTIMDEPDTTPPEILASLPRNKELECSITTEIILKISETIDTSTISPENIMLTQNGKPIDSKITYNPVISEINMIPTKPLQYDKNYELCIKDISDMSGNKMKKNVIKFKTTVKIDRTPPEILDIIPKNSSSDIPIDTDISLRFSEPISINSLSESILLSDDKNIIKTTLKYDDSRKVVSIKPEKKLLPNHHYRIIVKSDITDLFGNKMLKGINTDFITEKITEKKAIKIAENPPINKDELIDSTLSDITGVPMTSPKDIVEKTLPPKDDTIPEIIDYFPMNGFKGVALDTRISFIFSKQIEEKTLNPANIKITQQNHSYDFSIIYDYEYKRLTLTPKSTFSPKAKVTVVLTSGIKDKSGNNLKKFSVSFETGDSLDSEIEISIKKNAERKVTKPVEHKNQKIKAVPEIDFYSSENAKQNFTREEWAQYLVKKLQNIFDPGYRIKATNSLLKPTRYELAMILTHILKKYYSGNNNYLFSSRKGIAKLLLLEQAVIEFERELTIMGTNYKKFEDKLKKNGIPVKKIREDMNNGIIKGKK